MMASTFRIEGGSVRIAFAIVVPLGAALLQASLVPFMAVGGARPNVPLLLAGAWSVSAGAGEAVWWAFFGGLGVDLLSGGPLGAFAASTLPPVVAIGLADRSPARPTPVLVAVALIGIAALAAALLYVALLATLAVDAVSGALYTAVLGIVVYPVLRGVRALSEKESPF
jgi:rod shape-determining protein MreD